MLPKGAGVLDQPEAAADDEHEHEPMEMPAAHPDHGSIDLTDGVNGAAVGAEVSA
jgi:hypothetical protein